MARLAELMQSFRATPRGDSQPGQPDVRPAPKPDQGDMQKLFGFRDDTPAPGHEQPKNQAPQGDMQKMFGLKEDQADPQHTFAAEDRQRQNKQYTQDLRGGRSGVTIDELTTKEYNALSDELRAAVDANTALYTAAQQDKGLEKPRGKAGELYDQTMQRLFGETRDVYAPNTLALLDTLDLQDLSGRIDDFLNLDATVHVSDYGTLKQVGPTYDDMSPRAQLVRELTRSGGVLSDKIASGAPVNWEKGSLVSDTSRWPTQGLRMAGVNTPSGMRLGAPQRMTTDAATMNETLGQPNATVGDDLFNQLFGYISQKSSKWTYKELLGELDSAGYDANAFFQQAGEALAQRDAGTLESDKSMRSTADIRKGLGLTETTT